MAGKRITSPGGLSLFVKVQGSEALLQAGRLYRIGRNPKSDVVLTDPRVSWQHVALWLDDGAWLLEDSGSTNGTFVGSERVRQLIITDDCLIRLGHPLTGPAISCSLRATQVAHPPPDSSASPETPAAGQLAEAPAAPVSAPAAVRARPGQRRSAA